MTPFFIENDNDLIYRIESDSSKKMFKKKKNIKIIIFN